MTHNEKVKAPTSWCQDNDLSLNVRKTEEMIVDCRRQRGCRHPLIYTGGPEVNGFKFLGVQITEDLYVYVSDVRSTIKNGPQQFILFWLANSSLATLAA